MKTTVELPDDLVRQVKLRAVSVGHKLKDEIEALLRAGLEEGRSVRPAARTHRESRLPIIRCRHAAAPDEELTPKRVAAILADQESAWQSDPRR